MDPKYVGAKLAADRVAKEADLWRALELGESWAAVGWVSALLFAGSAVLLVLTGIPEQFAPMLLAILMFGLGAKISRDRQIRALRELLRIRTEREEA